MSIEHAEQLKKELTDKWVVVNSGIPELRRFQDLTGRVRTVNMNCRALVEFDGPVDIGWYDIDPSALTVVDGPKPKEKPAAGAGAAGIVLGAPPKAGAESVAAFEVSVGAGVAVPKPNDGFSSLFSAGAGGAAAGAAEPPKPNDVDEGFSSFLSAVPAVDAEAPNVKPPVGGAAAAALEPGAAAGVGAGVYSADALGAGVS